MTSTNPPLAERPAATAAAPRLATPTCPTWCTRDHSRDQLDWLRDHFGPWRQIWTGSGNANAVAMWTEYTDLTEQHREGRPPKVVFSVSATAADPLLLSVSDAVALAAVMEQLGHEDVAEILREVADEAAGGAE